MIIVVNTNKNDKIELTQEELQKYLKQAHDVGYQEAASAYWSRPYYCSYYNGGLDYNKVTCNPTGTPIDRFDYTISRSEDGPFTIKATDSNTTSNNITVTKV